MLKVAVLDDYQNVFNQIIDTQKFKNKFEFKVFNEAFLKWAWLFKPHYKSNLEMVGKIFNFLIIFIRVIMAGYLGFPLSMCIRSY